jgi:AbrB family looped-hinge helix DNA binding protein
MESIVSSKGQVTLPADIRKRLGIAAGTRLEFVVRGDALLGIVKLGGSVRELKAALDKPPRNMSLQGIESAIAQGASGRSALDAP